MGGVPFPGHVSAPFPGSATFAPGSVTAASATTSTATAGFPPAPVPVKTIPVPAALAPTPSPPASPTPAPLQPKITAPSPLAFSGITAMAAASLATPPPTPPSPPSAAPSPGLDMDEGSLGAILLRPGQLPPPVESPISDPYEVWYSHDAREAALQAAPLFLEDVLEVVRHSALVTS
eukprot:GAFH01001632.1.p3 GENE.GAFH01001632.1~~GAFH01001632.1.p3  ORF type:complete len:177 (+),score=31.18 GAFH01001632.1:737-1267(+)